MKILNNNKNRIYRFAVIAVVGSFVLMLAAQFGALALLGTKNTQLSKIYREKEDIRVAINRIQSNIDEAKTLAQINSGIDVVYQDGANKTDPVQILAKDPNQNLSLAHE